MLTIITVMICAVCAIAGIYALDQHAITKGWISKHSDLATTLQEDLTYYDNAMKRLRELNIDPNQYNHEQIKVILSVDADQRKRVINFIENEV